MKHVGANSYPEGSGSYPEGSGLFNVFFLGVRGSISPLRGCGCRTFFRGLRATVARHENHHDETCGSQFISRRFWFISRRFWPLNGPRSDPARCACLHMRSTISWWAQHFVTWYSGCFDASQCQGCTNITQCQKSWHGQHFVSCLKSGRSVAKSKFSSCV